MSLVRSTSLHQLLRLSRLLPRASAALALAGSLWAQHVASATAQDRAYLALNNAAQVAVVDLDKSAIVARIPVGALPRSAVASADGKIALVINDANQTISVIDTASNTVLETIKVANALLSVPSIAERLKGRDAPLHLGYAVPSPDGAMIYLAEGLFGALESNRKTGAVRPLTAGAGDGRNIAISRDGTRLLLLSHEPRGLTVVDTRSMTPGGLLGGLWSELFTASPDGKLAAAPLGFNEIGTASLDDFVLRKVKFRSPVRSFRGAGPHWLQHGIAISPDGRRLYAAARTHVQFHIFGIDIVTGAAVVSPPIDREPPSGIAVTPDGRRLVAALPGPSLVKVYDGATLQELRSLRVGPTPLAFRDFVVGLDDGRASKPIGPGLVEERPAPSAAPRPEPREAVRTAGDLAYIALNSAAQVAVVDLDRGVVVHRIPVGPQPRSTVASADGKVVLAVNDGDKTLSVIETATNTVVESIDLPQMLGPALKNNGIGHVVPSPDGALIYVAGIYYGVAAIDRKTRSLKTFGFGDGAIGSYGGHLAISGDGTKLFLPTPLHGLSILETKPMTVGGVLPELAGARFVVSDDGKFVAAVAQTRNELRLAALADFVARTVPFKSAHRIGPTAEGIDISPDGKRLYATCSGWIHGKLVSCIFGADLATGAVIASPLDGKMELSGIALTRDGRRLVAMIPSLGVVKVYDAATLRELRSIAVGPTPMAYRDFTIGPSAGSIASSPSPSDPGGQPSLPAQRR